jgi:hypothetical protein
MELSESSTMSLLSTKPLTMVGNVNKVETPVSQIANMTDVDPKLAGSASVFEQPLIRGALPGMMAHQQVRTTVEPASEPFQDRNLVSNEESNTSDAVPSGDRHMPSRHSRVPNTGNSVIGTDISQVLNTPSSDPESANQSLPRPSMPLAANQNRNLIPPTVQGEKRKSSQEKYSAIMLPSLKEETTPTASPVATLSHTRTDSSQQKSVEEVFGNPGILVKLHNDGKGDLLCNRVSFISSF